MHRINVAFGNIDGCGSGPSPGLACFAVLAAPRAAAAQQPVHWTLAPAPNAKAEAGQPITLVLTATIDEGWHLYAMTEPPGPIALTFAVDKSGPFSLSGAITESAPTKKFDPNFNLMTEYHETTATFTLPLTIAAGTPNGPHDVCGDGDVSDVQ